VEQPLPAAPPRPTEGRSPSALWRRVVVAAAAVTVLTGTVAAAAATQRDDEAKPAPAEAAPAAAAPAPEAPAAPAEPETGPGYRVVNASGDVFAHGWTGFAGSVADETSSPTVAIAHTADGEGYWVAAADGGVFAFGTAPFLGSAAGSSAHPMVDIAVTPTGNGYWLVAADGGVFAFGDAEYLGSGPEAGLAPRIVALAPTPSGRGYWLVASDGGVFTYGDAEFFGSMGDQVLNGGVIDLVPSLTGRGYYLVAGDGGVFTFGDAGFHGAALGQPLSRPIVDMALHPDGSGYWLLAADGGVFSFGSAPFLGAPVADGAKGHFTSIAAGIGRRAPAPTPAPAPPAEAPAPAPAAVEAPAPAPAELAAPPAPAPPAPAPPAPAAEPAKESGKLGAKSQRSDKAPEPPVDNRLLDGEFGWDISYPQCDGPYPEGPATYNIIGINGGRAFKHNKCLADEWRWARERGAAGVYVNVNFPRSGEELARGATSDRQPDCGPGALACVAYNFGLNGIRDSLAYAGSQGVDVPFIWLDVEQLNYWNPNPALNAVVLRGAIDAVREAGMEVGIYSTPYQFRKIMGDEQPMVPVWTAGANGAEAVASYCANKGFGGGPAVIVQLLPGQFDPNFACPGAGPLRKYFKL